MLTEEDFEADRDDSQAETREHKLSRRCWCPICQDAWIQVNGKDGADDDNDQ